MRSSDSIQFCSIDKRACSKWDRPIIESVLQNTDQIQTTACPRNKDIEDEKGRVNKVDSDDEEKVQVHTKNQYFIGKDYLNLCEKNIEDVERYNEGISFCFSSITVRNIRFSDQHRVSSPNKS